MILVRILAYDCMIHNRKIFIRYIKLKENILADSLSRIDLKRFWKNALKHMKPTPENLPQDIWPLSKVLTEEFFSATD